MGMDITFLGYSGEHFTQLSIVGIAVQKRADNPVAPQCQFHLPVVLHKGTSFGEKFDPLYVIYWIFTIFMFCWSGWAIALGVKLHGKHADKIGPMGRRVDAGARCPDRIGFGLFFDPVQDTTPLFDGPINPGAADGQLSADLGNGHILIQQLQQYAEQAQGKTGKP
jgi:hypothetical protein